MSDLFLVGTMSNIGPKTQALIALLDEFIAVLAEDNWPEWCRYLHKAKHYLEQQSATGLDMLNHALRQREGLWDIPFGVTMPEELPASPILREDYAEASQHFEALRKQISVLADDLNRTAEIGHIAN